jgi:hypothetical protein
VTLAVFAIGVLSGIGAGLALSLLPFFRGPRYVVIDDHIIKLRRGR